MPAVEVEALVVVAAVSWELQNMQKNPHSFTNDIILAITGRGGFQPSYGPPASVFGK